MVVKKLITGVVAFVAACVLLAAPVDAKKKCGKLCKNEIKDCVVAAKGVKTSCLGEAADKTAKKACKSAFKTAKKDCKQVKTDCKAAPEESPICSSPSAAFLD